MPFNGAGVYSAPGADFPVVTQTVISSTHFNNTINDIATALSLCLTKDGQQTATANINFGGFRATNVGITAIAGSVGTPAINVSDTGTGLYRSAASELAVTVAGSQVARFASTGLIVTGAASVSTTLTVTTSVVTPLVGTVTAADFAIQINGTQRWIVDSATQALSPASDNNANIGLATKRIQTVFSTIIDSGTTGSLSLRTGNGQTQITVEDVGGTAVNKLRLSGNLTTQRPQIGVGGETNVGLALYTAGTGDFVFLTAGAASQQFQVLHTASASRNITITGSNGGNPTISTTAGSLAITPSVVIAGASLSVGTTPAITGAIRLPYEANGQIVARNQANSADRVLLHLGTRNAVNDITHIGVDTGTAGVLLRARSGGAAPTTSDLSASEFTVWRDTGGATTKLYYNNAGALQSVALA